MAHTKQENNIIELCIDEANCEKSIKMAQKRKSINHNANWKCRIYNSRFWLAQNQDVNRHRQRSHASLNQTQWDLFDGFKLISDILNLDDNPNKSPPTGKFIFLTGKKDDVIRIFRMQKKSQLRFAWVVHVLSGIDEERKMYKFILFFYETFRASNERKKNESKTNYNFKLRRPLLIKKTNAKEFVRARARRSREK